jgi:hypothetical protein
MVPAPQHETFVGRSAELAMLEAACGGKDGAFIPIYGRRRIGKSELIARSRSMWSDHATTAGSTSVR